jgi:ribosome biogenesis GTPase
MKGMRNWKQWWLAKWVCFRHSGVGKSTLVNAMEPTLHLKTKTISEASKQTHDDFCRNVWSIFDARIIDTLESKVLNCRYGKGGN